MLAAFRPVPVLGELSGIGAEALGLPMKSVLATTTLANVGISSVYAGIGSLAGGGWSGFALIVAASLALPGVMMLLPRLVGRRAPFMRMARK